jgi:lysozyme
MKPSNVCVTLIQEFESCAKKLPDGRFQAYPDPATGGDPWTIGWGSTGPDIVQGLIWTQQQCDERFAEELGDFSAAVQNAIGDAATTQAQLDALVSFAYNVGTGNLLKSTLLKKHKAGDYDGAAAEFAKWNKANGQEMAGLTRRRAAEAKLYGS